MNNKVCIYNRANLREKKTMETSKRKFDHGDSDDSVTYKKVDAKPSNFSLFKNLQQQTDSPKTETATSSQPIMDGDLMHVGESKTGEKIMIKKYDFAWLRPENNGGDGVRVGVIGASGSGKTSTITMKALPKLADLGAWRIINPSEKSNAAYTPYVENGLIIHEDPDTETILPALYDFKARQIEMSEIWRIPGTTPRKYFRDPTGVLIIDDASEDQSLFTDKIFGWLYQNSRNANTIFFHLVQYAKTLCPKYRQQLSHLIFWRMPSPKEVKSIYNEFGGGFDNFEQFEDIYRKCTANGGCMIIWQACKSSKLEDRVFWFKNDFVAPTPYKVGAPWFRKLQRELFNPNFISPDTSRLNMTDEERAATVGKKKRKATTAIKSKPTKKSVFLIE